MVLATGLIQDRRATEKNKLNWWKRKCFESLPNTSAIVIYIYICTRYTVSSVASWDEVERGRDKVQRPAYTTCKVQDGKTWLVHVRSYGCLKAFSLWAVIRSGERTEPPGKSHWNPMTAECIYRFGSCFFLQTIFSLFSISIFYLWLEWKSDFTLFG